MRPTDTTELDLICVYCPKTHKCYSVRPARNASTISLRVTPPRNNQAVGVSLAASFRLVPSL